MIFDVSVDGKPHKVEITEVEQNKNGKLWLCKVDGQEFHVDSASTAREVMSVLVDGKAHEIKREYSLNGEVHVVLGSERFAVDVRDPRSLRSRRAHRGDQEGPQQIKAPMPGKVVRVIVAEGDEVEAGAGVVVVEAMKMQNEIKSPKKGKVQKIEAKEGTAVNSGDVLAIIE